MRSKAEAAASSSSRYIARYRSKVIPMLECPRRFEMTLDGDARFREQRGVGVAEIVEPDAPYPGAPDEMAEGHFEIPRRERTAVRSSKH
jgi:hypothetical protein